MIDLPLFHCIPPPQVNGPLGTKFRGSEALRAILRPGNSNPAYRYQGGPQDRSTAFLRPGTAILRGTASPGKRPREPRREPQPLRWLGSVVVYCRHKGIRTLRAVSR